MSAPVEPMTADVEARIRADVAADGGMLDGCADGALLLATIDALRAEVAAQAKVIAAADAMRAMLDGTGADEAHAYDDARAALETP